MQKMEGEYHVFKKECPFIFSLSLSRSRFTADYDSIWDSTLKKEREPLSILLFSKDL